MGHSGTIDEDVKMCIWTTVKTDIIQVSFREAHLKPTKANPSEHHYMYESPSYLCLTLS